MKPGRVGARGSYPKNSFNYLVQKRIEKLQSLQKQYTQHGSGEAPQARSNTEK
jgi:hypothetical protein